MKHNKNILRAALLQLLVIVAPEARAQQLMTDNGDGTYTIIMPAGDVTVTADVKKLLANNDITVTIPSQTYTGSAIEPAVTVKDGETTLTLGTDYEVAYSNNVNAGTATATITGKGNYSGEKAATFTISPKAVTNEDITVTIPSQTWTGNEIAFDETAVVVKDGEKTLEQATDYIVTAPTDKLQNTGNYTYTITGQGNYAGSREAMFTIADKLITADGQTISDATTWKKGVVSITGNSTVTFSERITISGTVTLNLGEGATLIAPKGIEVDKGNTLTIEGNGKLNATADKFYAAIGRGFHDSTSGTSGTININGGTVTAIGGRFAAAIGGGYEGVSGTINISGGKIDATGGYCAAGIGGGTFAACGVVNISGGQVTANGDRASGIGPGFDAGTSGTVTLGWTNESDGILASNYNDVETLRVADGKAFTASTGNIYIGTLDDDQRAEFAGKTLKPVFCTGVMLTKESQGLTATIDGTSTATINIPTAVTVDNVTYNRTFTVGKASTVMLPFDYTCTGSEGGKFYSFAGFNGTSPIMEDGNLVTSLTANTPYLFMPTGTSLTFTGGATLNTTGGGTKVTESDGYELHGTYTEKVWEENDSEIGKAYVYNDNGELTAVTAGTKIRPTECYILKTKTRMTDMGITVTIPSQEWTGSVIAFDETAVVVKDGETTLTLTTDYTVTTPTGTLQNTGDYPVTINGAGEYAGSKEVMFTITPKVTTYGALTTSEDQSGKVATIDGTSLGTVEITDNPVVEAITLNRKFSKDKASTIMLPFDYTCDKADGGVFYDFVDVKKDEQTKTNQWVATMTKVDKLTANTPYLFMPADDIDGITFTQKVTLNTTKGGECQKADKGSNWTFKGTYSYIKWTSNKEDADYTEERADEIGKVYGFAGVQKGGIDVGDFVKAKSGAKIRPMTCYLIWNDTPNNTRSMTRGTIDELPSSIVVRLLSNVGPGNQDDDDNQGGTTAIGTLDTETGEIDFGGWYDMSGRKLSAKPTQKGLYIHNGKKVIIK